jgi:error-prone DNA polymerase
MTDRYVELHAASAFSFLEGASQPEELIHRAAELSMPALAILDRNGVYGSARAHTSAIKKGVHAHVGAELAVSDFAPRLRPPSWLPNRCAFEPSRLPLLCLSSVGYQNLCRLITQMKLRQAAKSEGSATLEDLEQYAEGLVCLTGGEEGPLAAALALGGETEALKTAKQLVRIFGRENVYVELQRHYEREEEWRNQAALRIARTLGLPLLATNGVRYATAYDKELLDVLTAIRHHLPLEQAGRLLTRNNQRFLRSGQEMTELYRDIPHAVENTALLSGRLEFRLADLGYQFPRYPVDEGETMDSFLRKRVGEGVIKRYGCKHDSGFMQRVHKQIDYELSLIQRIFRLLFDCLGPGPVL